MGKIFFYFKFYLGKLGQWFNDKFKKSLHPYQELQNQEKERIKSNPREAERIAKKKKLDKKLSDKNVITVVEDENLMGVVLENTSRPITEEKIKKELCESKVNDIGLYFHNKKYHQVAIPFASGSAFRYNYRSDAMRKRLKPLLYPKSSKPFDRTHVIPIGYHGSENDNRLVVGWDSVQNRNEMANFEKKINQLNNNQRIIWFTSIELNDNQTASWHVKILDTKGKVIDSADFNYNCIFFWR